MRLLKQSQNSELEWHMLELEVRDAVSVVLLLFMFASFQSQLDVEYFNKISTDSLLSKPAEINAFGTRIFRQKASAYIVYLSPSSAQSHYS